MVLKKRLQHIHLYLFKDCKRVQRVERDGFHHRREVGGSSSQVGIELHCVVGEIWVQSPTATPICLSNGGKGGPGSRRRQRPLGLQ